MSERLRVLVTGKGGRESNLVEAYTKSEHVSEVYVVPGNPLMYLNANGKPVHIFPNIKVTDADEIAKLCELENIDLADVAQDNAVEAGVANRVADLGTPVIGPTREAGRIEWDKAWARYIARRAGVPQPASFKFTEAQAGIDFINSRPDSAYFIKASGLDYGKGALGATNSQEAIENIKRIKTHGQAADTYLIEEFLCGDAQSNFEPGEEFSCFILVAGRKRKLIGYAQDHKRGENFDQGEMTGGMGCYNMPICITEELNAEILSTIADPLVEQMMEEGIDYTGVMYLGGMLVWRNGVLKPHLVEVNSRWGDPEAQGIISGIKNDFCEVSMAAVEGNIDDLELDIDQTHRIVVVGASRGYPGDYGAVKGKQVYGIDQVLELDQVRFYPAGLTLDSEGRIVANGGRLFGIVGESSESLTQAASIAYGAMALVNIEGNNLHFRNDIGYRDRLREQQAKSRQ